MCEGVCHCDFSLDGHNDNAIDHLFMCLFSICMFYWRSVCSTVSPFFIFVVFVVELSKIYIMVNRLLLDI